MLKCWHNLLENLMNSTDCGALTFLNLSICVPCLTMQFTEANPSLTQPFNQLNTIKTVDFHNLILCLLEKQHFTKCAWHFQCILKCWHNLQFWHNLPARKSNGQHILWSSDLSKPLHICFRSNYAIN